jgi:hypothetical protein
MTAWPFTPDDVIHVGQTVDTWGRVTVAFRRGSLVQVARVDATPAASIIDRAVNAVRSAR